MEPGVLHPSLEQMKWLIGKWKTDHNSDSSEKIKYPKEIIFSSEGQPMLTYQACTRTSSRNNIPFSENGFLKIRPGSRNLMFTVNHSGFTTVEKGVVDKNKFWLESKYSGKTTFNKDPNVTALRREFSHDAAKDELTVKTYMTTAKTPMFEHSKCVYHRA